MKTNQRLRRQSKRIVQLNIEVPTLLHQGLKVVAAVEGRTVRELASDVLTRFYQDKKGRIKFPSFDLPALSSAGPVAILAA